METHFVHPFKKEALGKYFLRKGAKFASEKSYGKAYEFFKEGLDSLTCDCLWDISDWLEPYTRVGKNFPSINFHHNPVHEYFFVKAYILSFYKQKSDLYAALDSIENYLREIEDDYGFYVKGRILNSLGEHQLALDSFQNGLKYARSSRLLYRIGGTKEGFLNQNGSEELYNSFLINPSSGCCCRVLNRYFRVKGNSLNIANREINPLTISFNTNNDEFLFQKEFNKALDDEFNDDEDICDIQNKFTKFISDIRFNSKQFIKQPELEENEHSSYDNYGSSYEEYGGYNGWSDDVIDDAFDGDPEATWNVD